MIAIREKAAKFRRGDYLWRGAAVGLLMLTGLLGATSCSYKSKNILFKDGEYQSYYRAERKKGKAVVSLKPDTVQPAPHRFVPGDVIRIQYANVCDPLMESITRMSPNAGGVLSPQQLSLQSAGAIMDPNQVMQQNLGGYQYTVDPEGMVLLPLQGRLKAVGLTPLALRDSIERYLRGYCRDMVPTIELTVASFRAFIFNEGGRQGVVPLPNERTPLPEFIALAGGISFFGKANKIQIIRGDPNDPQVIWVDLQAFESLRYPNLYIYPNDIIYVEPREIARVGRSLQTVTAFIVVFNLLVSILVLTRL